MHRVVLELAAQLGDGLVHRVVAIKAAVPDIDQQLLGADHLAGTLGQRHQHLHHARLQRDAFAVARAGVTVAGTVPTTAAPRFVGFEVTDYQLDPPTAAVSVAQTIGTDPQLYAYPVALQWIDDDWRIVLPTPEDNIDAAEIADLTGYTTLEGAS